MRSLAWSVGLVLMVTLGFSPVAYGDPRGPRVLVIGDSLTARAQKSLSKVRPGWTVDGVRGRNVRKLPSVIQEHLNQGTVPDVLVIALGTNEDPAWTKDSYVAATRMLPPTTRVVFITCRRDPAFWGDRDVLLRTYSRWMTEIVKERPLTTKVSWRQRTTRQPELLFDGVHASAQGERVWVTMVTREVDRALELVPAI